jgi:methylmalonyl-CoA/ethylmalonyl-CoA epimerase
VAVARPAIAYGGRLIQFFVAPSRLMIELIEAPEHEHRYEQPASLRIA